ncbi:hypothetical protein KR52_11365 [Synechococcus sp. KORDI-52]|nr:hypothetical protein KR52_11365 [Synechococcus sp. KORDI-52]
MEHACYWLTKLVKSFLLRMPDKETSLSLKTLVDPVKRS